MALKRKRSSAPVASPASECSDASLATQQSNTSAIPHFYHQTKPVEPLYHKPTWAFPTYEEDSAHLLNSRTRKRHRDDRPDEEDVYASTMNKLYQAQLSNPNASPVLSNQSNLPTIMNAPQPQKSTLHAFWNINQPPASVPMAIDTNFAPTNISQGRCSDCDGSLLPNDSMDMDNNILEQETACQNCNYLICDRCAVHGNQRMCLPCATNGSR